MKTDARNYVKNAGIPDAQTKKNGAKITLDAVFFEELRINIIRRS